MEGEDRELVEVEKHVEYQQVQTGVDPPSPATLLYLRPVLHAPNREVFPDFPDFMDEVSLRGSDDELGRVFVTGDT